MLNIGYILDGKYEVLKILGCGGMGTVYLCRNNRLGNLWAIKEVTNEWKGKIDFLTEPKLLKDLQHPGIPKVIDIFIENENLYMVEDYIAGENLKELIEKQGPLSAEKVANIALKLCDILAYLHSFSPPIIYRDLKPSNIMLKSEDEIVLVDFGIARTFKEQSDSDTVVLGSRGYMAPELLNNTQSNIKSDIYSLGATLNYILTGEAISSLQPAASKLQGVTKTIEAISKTKEVFPETNSDLTKIIHKAASIDPESRYSNISEVKAALQQTIEEYPKTTLMNVNPINKDSISKTLAATSNKLMNKKISKKAVIAASGLLILIAVFAALYMMINQGNKDTAKTNASNKAVEDRNKKTDAPAKVPVDKDVVTRGLLYKDNPLVLSNNYEASKGKGKNKGKGNQPNFDLLFTLNPSASLSNSNISVTLNSIEVVNSITVLDLSISNITNSTLNLNLNKTYFLNGSGTAFNPSFSGSSIIAVSQNSNQDIKLTFDGFDFIGNSYCFKTSINYGVNKEISLYLDVK